MFKHVNIHPRPSDFVVESVRQIRQVLELRMHTKPTVVVTSRPDEPERRSKARHRQEKPTSFTQNSLTKLHGLHCMDKKLCKQQV